MSHGEERTTPAATATAAGRLDSGFPIVEHAACDLDGHCVTCSDEALPARVLEIDGPLGMAVVEVDGIATEVDISLVDTVRPGQWLLVHGGVAMMPLEDR